VRIELFARQLAEDALGKLLRSLIVTHVEPTAECQSLHPQNARSRSWSRVSVYVGTQK
jgi:hypothetical protein